MNGNAGWCVDVGGGFIDVWGRISLVRWVGFDWIVNEDDEDFGGRIVTGASSGGASSSLCFSFQCLFKLFLHLYKFPHKEQANFTADASSGSGTRRYRLGSTETLYGRLRSGIRSVCWIEFECDEVTDRSSFLFVLVDGFYQKSMNQWNDWQKRKSKDSIILPRFFYFILWVPNNKEHDRERERKREWASKELIFYAGVSIQEKRKEKTHYMPDRKFSHLEYHRFNRKKKELIWSV